MPTQINTEKIQSNKDKINALKTAKSQDTSQWQTVQCKILEAEYLDGADLAEEEPELEAGEDVTHGVLLSVKILDTGQILPRVLTSQQLREHTGLSRDYTATELIHFATELNKRNSPINLKMPPGPIKRLEVAMFDDEPVEIVPSSIKYKPIQGRAKARTRR